MNRNDAIGLIGIILFVGGIGGGFELTLCAQSRVYENVMAVGGAADLGAVTRAMQQTSNFIKIGIPIGMLGVMLLAIAIRGYFRALEATMIQARSKTS